LPFWEGLKIGQCYIDDEELLPSEKSNKIAFLERLYEKGSSVLNLSENFVRQQHTERGAQKIFLDGIRCVF